MITSTTDTILCSECLVEVPLSQFVIHVMGEEYFDNASPAILKLFLKLTDCPDMSHFDILDLVFMFYPFVDGTYDAALEEKREESVAQLESYLKSQKTFASSILIQHAIKKLAGQPKTP